MKQKDQENLKKETEPNKKKKTQINGCIQLIEKSYTIRESQ